MHRIAVILLVALLTSGPGLCQKNAGVPVKIAFYNTENIFDTIDDPSKSDEDFLPGSKIAWTGERLNTKLQHIASVLIAIDSTNLPAAIGLAEVENLAVLKDLISKTGLKRGNYEAILEEGSDPRGIDVALVYRKDVFTLAAVRAFPSATSFKTRALLYVKLTDAKKDTFHLFVNHWKSRSGGAELTETKRIENARVLKHLTDSLLRRDAGARVILMGDFNDEPANKSMAETLEAMKPGKKIAPALLYNLMYDRFLAGEGTLYYKDWDLFDQFIVSGNLLIATKGKKAAIQQPYSFIFRPDWLMYKNKEGLMTPNRTAGSKEYYGGYSDHLPVYIQVNL